MEFGGLEVHFKVDGEVLTVTGICLLYTSCNWGWKRAIQLAEEYYREADPGLRGSILQLRYMERRRREEVMDKLNISYSTYQKAHDDLLSTVAVFAAHYGEL